MSSDFNINIGHARLQLIKGDITNIAVDAIVNAANSALAGGGGVDGAIHSVGGPDIMRELDTIRKRIGHCATGTAVVTGAGRLPARYVLHTVGPVYQGGNQGEPALLESCYKTCLDIAASLHIESVSFPSISAGVYGYPIEEAAQIAVGTVGGWLSSRSSSLRTIKLVQFSHHHHDVYCRVAQQLAANHRDG